MNLSKISSLLLAFACTACQGANFYSVNDDIKMGAQAFDEVKETEEVLYSGPEFDQVQRVTARLVEAARKVDPSIAQFFEWEVCVIREDDTVNAFCLPGGKMAVYTGILPVAGSDAGLAVVLGHEIAHATLRHGTQRVTQGALTQIGIEVFTQNVEISDDESEREMATILAEVGLGLPFSRSHELEADEAGLTYMATAGYNPEEAVGFWQRMASKSAGAPPEWLSTHPSDSNRIRQIKELLPKVMPIYKSSEHGLQ